jgi:hypothetical protein
VEGRRLANVGYVEAVPVAVVFRVTCVGKVLDRKLEQVAVAALNAFEAFEFLATFEVVAD